MEIRRVDVISVNYEDLEYLYSRGALLKLSKNPKKVYKNGLVAIFVTSFIVGDYNRKRKEYTDNLNFCKALLKKPRDYEHEEAVNQTNQMVQSSLSRLFVKNPTSEETKNKIIELMREIIKSHLNGQRYLMTYDDLNNLLDVIPLMKKLYMNTNPNISHHNWFELDLEKGLIHTFPEFITYGHLTSLWNMYVDKKKEIEKQYKQQSIDRLAVRTLSSEQHALHFSLWIQAVTFAESYLYYIFYNVQKSNYPLKSEAAKKFINTERPEDDHIIKSLILPEFSSEENKDQIRIIKKLHTEYSKINKVRNRLIHASAFVDSEHAHLLPLISSTQDELINALEVSRNLVLEIEKILPENLIILHWWVAMKHPDFKNFEKGSFVTRTDI
jgi:hypothetical protein